MLTNSPLNRLRFLALSSVLSVAFAVACGGADDGGNHPDAAATGGHTQNTGGAATGGRTQSTGGSSTGGSATGGSATGGSATGGSATGGSSTGGAATGGSSTGGAGGKGTGGAGMGGMSGSCSLTYDGFAKPFFTKYCVSCHSPGKKDLRTQAMVKAASSDIKKEAVSSTGMPPSSAPSKPTSSERAQLGTWLDCGAP